MAMRGTTPAKGSHSSGSGTRMLSTTSPAKTLTPQCIVGSIRQQFASWEQAYPDLRVEVLDARPSEDQVFLWVRFAGHGATSGIPLEMELAHLYTMRDGKAEKLVEYMDRDHALEAAGLSD